jgi:hypothetical protein
MPNPGDVLFYKDFEFIDGSKKDKLFVVICHSKYCLMLKTTSNDRFYKDVKEGCNPQKHVFFIPRTNKEFFNLDTYIQFPQLFEISIKELLKGSFSKRIKNYELALSETCVNSILFCLKNFKDDISHEHWDMIFPGNKNTPSIDSLQKLTKKFRKK